MTKFIPKLKQISTKFSGFETELEPVSDKDSQPIELEPPFTNEAGNHQSDRISQTLPSDRQPENHPTPETVTYNLEDLGEEEEEDKESFPPVPPAWEASPSNPPNGQHTTAKPSVGKKTSVLVPTTNLLAGFKQVSGKTKQDLQGFARKVLSSPWLDPKNPLYRTRKFWVGVGLGVGVGGTAIGIGATWWSLERSLPDPNYVFSFVRDGTLTIKALDGSILQQIGPATREKYDLQQMPPQLVQAFIAAEDHRFYQHKGVDYQGVARAFATNLMARNVVEGGSTITQQLARIVFLTPERTLGRKLQEMMLAQKMEQKMSKQQILERYLNLVYLGEGAYGVADAAWVYYSKSLQDLTLPEIATIVGVTPAPSIFSPLKNLEGAQERRNIVLNRMQQAGFITPEQAKAAAATPIALQPAPPKRLSTEAEYFTAYIQQELPKYVSPDAIEAGGLTVETSLNRDWQSAAETAVREIVKEYGPGQRFGQGALVAIDPRNGEVKALVGGTDFDRTKFNRATQAQRQPGSTFKGFLYATAIAGGFSPYRGYLDAPLTVDGYTPKNFDGENNGWISIRDALAKSVNVVAVRVLLDVGFQPTIDIARKMGIKSELKPTYSLALGASEVNLLELTSAYGTLATNGVHTEPHGIRRVLDRRGNVLYQANFKSQPAIDADTSSIVTWMLQEVVKGGTGRAAYLPDRPVAGKTGTSDQARDLWFIGYIPQMVTGVWLGNDDNTPTWGASSTAARTWHKFMVKAVEGMPVEKFSERPQKLEGRKATLALQPIKPGKVYSPKVATSRSNRDDDDDRNSRTVRSVRRQENVTSTATRRARSQSDSNSIAPSARRQTASARTVVRTRRRYSQAAVNTDNTSSSSPRRTSSRSIRRRYSTSTNSASTPPVQQPRRRRYSNSNNNAQAQSSPPTQRRSRTQQYSSRSASQPTRRSSVQTATRRQRYNSTPKPSTSTAQTSRRSVRSRSTRSSQPAPAASRQLPSLAKPQPAAAPPTIELNTHR
ncbi:MAG TPA: penicillin-binding protein 1A [Leptolyngbyaceae cyanobacterium]